MKKSILFIDQVTERLAKLRIPYWFSCTLFGFAIVLPSILTSVPIIQEKEFYLRYSAFIVFMVFLISYPLFVLGQIPSLVKKHMNKFQTVLREPEDTYQTILHKMVWEIPLSKVEKFLNNIFWPILLSVFVIAAIKYGIVDVYGNLIFVLFWILSFLVVTKVFTVLFEINKLKERSIEINLLNLSPIKSLANLTQRIAIYIIPMAIALSVFGAVVIAQYAKNSKSNFIAFAPLGVAGTLLLILSIFMFVVPVFWIRQLILDKKEKVLSDLSLKLEKSLQIQDEFINAENLSDIEKSHTLITSLLARKELYEKVSEWPWERRVLQEFVIAIIIPLILWLSQSYMGRYFDSS